MQGKSSISISLTGRQPLRLSLLFFITAPDIFDVMTAAGGMRHGAALIVSHQPESKLIQESSKIGNVYFMPLIRTFSIAQSFILSHRKQTQLTTLEHLAPKSKT